MIRFLVRTLITLAGNAVGLLVAAALLDDMNVDAGSFIVALVIFTIVMALAMPFLASSCGEPARRRSAGSPSSPRSPHW